MTYVMTEREFANKIDWEGGILDALDYGLTPEDVEPGQLQDAWQELYDVWRASLEPAVTKVEEIIWELDDEEDE